MTVVSWRPGDPVVWRSRPYGQVGYVVPLTLVVDTPDVTVLFQTPGSICKRRSGRRSGPLVIGMEPPRPVGIRARQAPSADTPSGGSRRGRGRSGSGRFRYLNCAKDLHAEDAQALVRGRDVAGLEEAVGLGRVLHWPVGIQDHPCVALHRQVGDLFFVAGLAERQIKERAVSADRTLHIADWDEDIPARRCAVSLRKPWCTCFAYTPAAKLSPLLLYLAPGAREFLYPFFDLCFTKRSKAQHQTAAG